MKIIIFFWSKISITLKNYIVLIFFQKFDFTLTKFIGQQRHVQIYDILT